MPKKEKPELHYHVWLGSAYTPATTEQWAAEWVRAAATITGIPGTLFRILGCRARWTAPACIQAAELDAMVAHDLAEERDDVHHAPKDDLAAFIAFRQEKARDDREEVDYPPADA